MEFKYTGYFYVEEGELEEMKKKIAAGENPERVYYDWSIALDDDDYYTVDFVKDQIMAEITKGV